MKRKKKKKQSAFCSSRITKPQLEPVFLHTQKLSLNLAFEAEREEVINARFMWEQRPCLWSHLQTDVGLFVTESRTVQMPFYVEEKHRSYQISIKIDIHDVSPAHLCGHSVKFARTCKFNPRVVKGTQYGHQRPRAKASIIPSVTPLERLAFNSTSRIKKTNIFFYLEPR